jgi:hypothetical protein
MTVVGCPQKRGPQKRKKEDKTMEALTWIFTLCGAATLAHGLMAIIEVLDRE